MLKMTRLRAQGIVLDIRALNSALQKEPHHHTINEIHQFITAPGSSHTIFSSNLLRSARGPSRRPRIGHVVTRLTCALGFGHGGAKLSSKWSIYLYGYFRFPDEVHMVPR